MPNLPSGMPAGFNPVARDLQAGPAQAQLKQAVQQTAVRGEVYEEMAEMAANQMAMNAKNGLLRYLNSDSGNPSTPAIMAIADQPQILQNLGMS